MQQLNLQFYARTDKEGFSEQLSVCRTVVLTADPQPVHLSIDAPPDQELVELRFDPDDKPSEFVLHDLLVRSAAGDLLYRWDGEPRNLSGLAGLRATKFNGQAVFESSTDDPFMLIPLDRAAADGVSVDLSLSLAIEGNQDSVAEAVRSLQSSLRLAIDDLAAEQEGLQDALLVQQTHERMERHSINDQLQSVLGRADRTEKSLRKLAAEVGGIDAAVAKSVNANTLRIRNEILTEIRDDWRSVRQHVSDTTEMALRRVGQLDNEIASSIEQEFGKLIEVVRRVAASEDLLGQVRTELSASRDDEIIHKVQRLKEEARRDRDRAETMERSLSWRLTRPFRLFATSSSNQAGKRNS